MSVTIEQIKMRLKQPLPGETAHFPLYPSGRPVSSKALQNRLGLRDSAVALIVYQALNNDLNVVLTQRNVYNGMHSGQICFPGGKKEDSDKQLEYTAIRESQEEIGIQPDKLNLLGKLTPVYVPVSNFKIQPFVFHYEEMPIFVPDQREVAEVFSFSLRLLLKEDIIKRTQLDLGENHILENVPYFDIHQKIVWGATAFMLNEFRTILQK